MNVAGYLEREDVISCVKEMGFTPLRVERLTDAKHIFSHVEWHMRGYMIRVEALDDAVREGQEFLFAESADFKENYPLPSAFAAYAKHLNVFSGKKREPV